MGDSNDLVRGQELLVAERASEAVKCFDRALRANPRSASALRGLAESYTFLGQHESARRTLRQLTRMVPNDPDAHALLGEAAYASDRVPDARASLERALDLDPRHRRALEAMAVLLESVGEDAPAKLFRDRLAVLQRRDAEGDDVELPPRRYRRIGKPGVHTAIQVLEAADFKLPLLDRQACMYYSDLISCLAGYPVALELKAGFLELMKPIRDRYGDLEVGSPGTELEFAL